MIKTLSLTPLVFEIENFLDPEETAHIREGAYVLTGGGGGVHTGPPSQNDCHSEHDVAA